MSKEKFIKLVTDGLTAPPQYFFDDAMINKNGYDNIDAVMKRNLKTLNAEEVKREMAKGILVLDTRDPIDFEKGFIKGSLNVGLDGQFAVWVGTVVKIDQPLIVVADEGKEEEAIFEIGACGF